MAKLIVVLEVSESIPGEALDAMENMLDEGTLQDALNEFCDDTGRAVHVEQASVRYAGDGEE